MTPTADQVNEVLEKIREVCDLKRLEFGCEVQSENGSVAKIVKFYDDDTFQAQMSKYYPELEVEAVITMEKCKLDKVKIIGLPVQLNHLLWAIDEAEKKSTSYALAIYTDGKMSNRAGEYITQYDLQKSVEDNLRSNPELNSWIHGILCK